MSTLTETRIVTSDGIVTATILDEVSPERITLYLIKGAYASQFAQTEDTTPVIPRSIRDLLVSPLYEVTT